MPLSHERFMRVALSLANRQLGRTWPNPAVGAIIVKDGQIIGQGITANGGRPHAETIALNNVGELASDATLYVTLEPCAHHGKTPPCVDAIIAAKIKTVVVACRDRNPLVSGKGIAALRKAGMEVIENICEKEALEINQRFFSFIAKKRPYVALKIATSADDKITNPPQRWITGEIARNYGHMLRANYDAILTGIGTVLADDPQLTCRLSGLENYSPVRVVVCRYGTIPDTAKILSEQEISPTWVMNEKTIEEVLTALAQKGITSVLVEAGAKLSAAFLDAGVVDRIYHFRAAVVVGDSGLSVAGSISKLASFKQIEHIKLGDDNLEIYECSQE